MIGDQPRWRQVAEVIRQRIADGTYAPRTRVPSVLQLQAEFGIAAATGQTVHRALREDGLIFTEIGPGSFVARPLPLAGDALTSDFTSPRPTTRRVQRQIHPG